jgi:hypothetical protein
MRVSFEQIIYRIFNVCFSFFRSVPRSTTMRLPCGCHAAVMHCYEVVMHYQAAVMNHHSASMHLHAAMCSKSVKASLIKTALREQTKISQWREKMRITLYCTESERKPAPVSILRFPAMLKGQ